MEVQPAIPAEYPPLLLSVRPFLIVWFGTESRNKAAEHVRFAKSRYVVETSACVALEMTESGQIVR
jgi:hypothetical protein